MIKKLSFLLSVLILSFAFGYFIFAWTEPGSVPPGGNVPAPINVGSETQTKIGAIRADGGFQVDGYEMVGSNADKLYANRRNTTGGGIWISDDGGLYDYNNGYIDFRGSTGIRVLESDGSWGNNSIRAANLCIQNDCRSSWPSISESDTLQTVTNRGRVTSQTIRSPRFEDYNNTAFYADPASTSYFNDMRASIYYDRDNTGYYVNPAGTNRMNYVYGNRLRADSINLDGDELRFYRSTDSIIRKTDAYLELHGSVNGNSRIWLQDDVDRIYIGDGNTDIRIRGNVDEVDNLYADRYYDDDNTSYYADPASTSYFNDMRASIYYDRDNTGYYVNPASTSNLNNLRIAGTLRIQYTRVDRNCNNRYCKATCPSGWRVIGGGCEASGVVIDNRPEYRWRSDWDRSWVCYGGDGAYIEWTYAICLKIQQP